MENNENLEQEQEQPKVEQNQAKDDQESTKTTNNSNAPKSENTPKVPEKSKKPIYKKWWFWVIIGIIIIALISGGSDNTPNDNQSNTDSSSESSSNNSSSKTWNKSGTYKVGVDIEAGEYFVECTSYNCYIQLSSNSTGTLDSIIANDNISTHTYITVREGEYLTVNGGKFAPASKVSAVAPISNGVYGEGMYKIGKDIPAGEYKIVATNFCYIEVSSNSNHTLNSIITNDNIEVGTTTYITVSDGQYLKVKGGKIQAP